MGILLVLFFFDGRVNDRARAIADLIRVRDFAATPSFFRTSNLAGFFVILIRRHRVLRAGFQTSSLLPQTIAEVEVAIQRLPTPILNA